MTKYTNKGLIAYARAMLDYHSGYWYGTYGNFPANEALYNEKRKQYPSQYDKWPKSSFVAQYGTKVHDCAGLVKGYLMSPCIDASGFVTDVLRASVYNSKYDLSANGMIAACKETGDISTLPEIEGLILWKDGHVAIYDKDGYCIEEKGHAFGTVRSKVADRGFKKWGKHPAIEYITEDPQPSPSGDGIIMPDLKWDAVNKVATKCNEVTLFQILANDLGYKDADGKKLVVDGSFGKRCECVCIQIQRDNHILATGICNESTWRAILHKRFT